MNSPPGEVIFINAPEAIVGDEVKFSIPGRVDSMNNLEVEIYGR